MAEQDGMNDIIQLLPDSVANQIAAGEVIQRPASVIKELVENSVDAEARNIEIVIKDAGKTLIQVIDDGKGMSTTDTRMAFERHATSKIRCADDLFKLHTMGFRGEALPSVAAVSELEIISRRECDELGTKLVIRASKAESQEPAMAIKGTNIKVKNLFYNFVARRRFLKKDSVELNHIVAEFERLSLVNTDVAFKLSSNGVLLHSLPKGPLKDRIGSLFGKSISEKLIPVKVDTSLVSLEGFISLPEGARQRGHRQFLFVNGRNMRHPYFHRAILSCYENLIPKDSQPHYFIKFNVSPDRIDVNIHPQKHEIKFEDEQSIWQILTAAIREALGRHGATSSIEFNNAGAPDIPPLVEGAVPEGDLSQITDSGLGNYNPFELKNYSPSSGNSKIEFDPFDASPMSSGGRPSALNSNRTVRQSSVTAGWEKMFAPVEKKNIDSNPEEGRENQYPAQGGLAEMDDSSRRTLFQVREKYIVTEDERSLILIDQHRAHTAILYSDLKAAMNTGEVASQSLLFPETLDLDSQEKVMLDSSIELLEKIGFRFGRDNDTNYTLEGIPGSVGPKNPVKILHSILNDLAESGVDVEDEALNRIALTTARSAALTAGYALTQTEMKHLVTQLFALPSPNYTSDGLRIMVRLSDDKLLGFFQ